MFLRCIIQKKKPYRGGCMVGSNKKGSKRGEKKRLVLTGFESWKELPLHSGPMKLVSEIILLFHVRQGRKKSPHFVPLNNSDDSSPLLLAVHISPSVFHREPG
jgi:hypothetical protein